MRFYWLQDRVNQGQFHIFWAPGSKNLADYFTKHHPAIHHNKMRYYYLYSTTKSPKFRTSISTLRGCVDPESYRVDSSSGFRVPIVAPVRPTAAAQA